MSFCRQVVPKLPSCFRFGKTLAARFLGVEQSAPILARSPALDAWIPQCTHIGALNFNKRNDMTGETPFTAFAAASASGRTVIPCP
jgi:hypothetical protein